MIVDFATWQTTAATARPSVCIVGAGPAGLDLAAQLARGRRTVLVLEGGGRELDPRAQRLHRVRFSGREPLRERVLAPGEVAGKEALRPRVLGGTGTIWSGNWRLPDPALFSARPWIPDASWPIPWSELEPFARDAMRTYGAPARELLKIVRPPGLAGRRAVAVTHLFTQTPPADFARVHAQALAAAPNITVVLGAHVTELLPAPGGASVGELVVRSLSGATVRVTAENYVLAAGAIQTARLLLASTRFGGRGPGNLGGQVGRWLLDEPRTRLGRFFPQRAALRAGLCGQPSLARRGLHPRIQLPPDRQRELQLANHALAFSPPAGPAPGRGRGAWLGGWWREPPPYEIFLEAEQLPHRENRVALDSERDELGMPLPDVHWNVAAEDEAGVRRFVAEMKAILEPDYGRFDIDEAGLSARAWSGAAHPMGATRMAASEREGVVDRDGRVFGVGNLHVAGSAVFPAGDPGEPMALILALTRRLARRLE